MAQGLKRSKGEESIMDDTKDEVGGGESTPHSSSAQKPFQKRVRLPARFASHLFELTKQLGFKSDGRTVEWLFQQSLSDQDPYRFSSDNNLLIENPQQDMMVMKTPPRKKRPLGMPKAKDRHRQTEDGRDRRVRVPDSCISQLILLTQTLALKSYGDTIEWLFKKYWLSAIRPQEVIQPRAATNSTFPFTAGSFNDAYLSPDNESSIFPIYFSIPTNEEQYNFAGLYEQNNFMEPVFYINRNSEQHGVAPSPYDLYLPVPLSVGSANQLQHIPYPPQQTGIQAKSLNFLSWSPEAGAGKGMAANDGLGMEGSSFEPPVQMGSLQNNLCIYDHAYAKGSSAMAAERLVPAENMSYAEQVCNPNSTSLTSIPQSYYTEYQLSLPYKGIVTGTTEPALYGTIYTSGSMR